MSDSDIDRDLDFIRTESPEADASGEALAGAEVRALNHASLKEGIKQLEQDREERKKYAGRSFGLVCGWLLVLGLLMGLQGFRVCGFLLSDSVLIALVTSTTASIVAIFVLVTKYLFPQR